jgi:hypothetical protein
MKVESFLMHDDEMCVTMSFKAMFTGMDSPQYLGQDLFP